MLKLRNFVISLTSIVGGMIILTAMTMEKFDFTLVDQIILSICGGSSIILGFTSYTLKFLDAMKKGWPVKFE